MAGLDLGGQAEIAHDTFEPPLECRVGAVVEVACSAGVCGRGPRGRRERERRAETGEAAEQVRKLLGLKAAILSFTHGGVVVTARMRQ